MKKFLFFALIALTFFTACEQTDDEPIVNNAAEREGETFSDTITVKLTSPSGVVTYDNLILKRCPDTDQGVPGPDGTTWEMWHIGRDNKGNYYKYTEIKYLWPGGGNYFCCPTLTNLTGCP